MSENLHNIDKLFKNAIEDHEELPSSNVWNNIDNGLDKNKVVSIQKKYYVLKRVAVAVFIFGFVASVFAIYFNSRYYNPQAKNDPSSINNQATMKSNNKISQKQVNNLNKSNSERKDQSSNTTDASESSSRIVINSNPSSSASNTNDAALSSEDNNKINQEPLSSNPSITTAKFKSKENVLQNKTNLVSSKHEANRLFSTFKEKNKTQSLNQAETKNNSSLAEVRIRESIVSNHLLYSFQPTFSKSFSHSDIATIITASISKLKKQPHIAVTVFAGLQKNIAHFKDDDDQQGMRRGSRDEFKHSEQSTSSVRTGVLFEYPFASNWSIGSGLMYTTNITSIDPKVVFARQDDRGNIKYEFNCSAGYAYIPAKTGSTPLIGDSAKVFNSKTRISYVSIPVTAGYNLSAGRFILKPTAGFLLNFLTTGKVQSEISSSSINTMSSTNSISGLKSGYLSGELNLTTIYQVNNKIGIMMAPNIQFALTSINKNTSVKTYPGYIGVIGGVRVAF